MNHESKDPSEAHTIRAPKSVWDRFKSTFGDNWRSEVGKLVTRGSELGLSDAQMNNLERKAAICGMSAAKFISKIIEMIDLNDIAQLVHTTETEAEIRMREAVDRENQKTRNLLAMARNGCFYDSNTDQFVQKTTGSLIAIADGVKSAIRDITTEARMQVQSQEPSHAPLVWPQTASEPQVVPEVPPTPPTAASVPAEAIPTTPEWHTQAPEAMPVRLGFGPMVGR